MQFYSHIVYTRRGVGEERDVTITIKILPYDTRVSYGRTKVGEYGILAC
jgi:hypothetical protein